MRKREPSEEEIEENIDYDQMEDATFKDLQRPPQEFDLGEAHTETAKTMQFVHQFRPFTKDETGRVTGGHVPPEVLEEFYGLTAPIMSMSNFTDKEIKYIEDTIPILHLANRGCHKRVDFDATRNFIMKNVDVLSRGVVSMSRDGFGRRMDATQITEERKNVHLARMKSRTRNAFQHVKGSVNQM